MRAIAAVALVGLILAAPLARAHSFTFRCVSSGDPKSPREDYVVDSDDNSVTVILHDKGGNVLSSKSYPARIAPTSVDWTVEKAGGTTWTQHYDRATGTLTSSNTEKESFTQACK